MESPVNVSVLPNTAPKHYCLVFSHPSVLAKSPCFLGTLKYTYRKIEVAQMLDKRLTSILCCFIFFISYSAVAQDTIKLEPDFEQANKDAEIQATVGARSLDQLVDPEIWRKVQSSPVPVLAPVLILNLADWDLAIFSDGYVISADGDYFGATIEGTNSVISASGTEVGDPENYPAKSTIEATGDGPDVTEFRVISAEFGPTISFTKYNVLYTVSIQCEVARFEDPPCSVESVDELMSAVLILKNLSEDLD